MKQELLRHHLRWLFFGGALRSRLNRLVRCEDARRDAALRAAEIATTPSALDKLAARKRPVGSLHLARATVLAFLEYLKKKRRQLRTESLVVFDPKKGDWVEREVSARPALPTREAMERDEVLAGLVECILKLPDVDREVAIRRYYMDQENKVIAAEMGMTENTVAQRLHRLRLKLAKCLGRDPG